MKQGSYIVLEGPQGAGKSTMADLVVHELERLGLTARKMHEPDSRADPTTAEIRRITQDPAYPMNSRTEVLLYNAARSQSLEAIRMARNEGVICVVDRSYLSTLAVQFYGRGDIPDYQRLNDIITFAVADMWPDLTIVLDAPVTLLQERCIKRAEHERFDELDVAMLEKIRAGYLWEAQQRGMPVVHTTGRIDEVFTQVWQHIAPLLPALKSGESSESKPAAIADLLAQSPAAQVLKDKKTSPPNTHTTYFTPTTLLDDIQCDYCDGVEQILSSRRSLADSLAAQLSSDNPSHYASPAHAKKAALTILRPLLPVACAHDGFRQLLSHSEPLEIDQALVAQLPPGFASATEPVRLASWTPRNELDLIPAMLYSSLDLPYNELQTTVATWPYELKSQLFEQYIQHYPTGKALANMHYSWDILASLVWLQDIPEALRSTAQLQILTPRYGYDMPPEVEAAGLSDEYDAVFDQSLQLHSLLYARGFQAEAQHATLLGHKQRWLLHARADSIQEFTSESYVQTLLRAAVTEKHPILWSGRLNDK